MPDKRTIFAFVMIGVSFVSCCYGWQYGPEFFTISGDNSSILMIKFFSAILALIVVSILMVATENILGLE